MAASFRSDPITMKFAVALLALVSVTLAAPQPKKVFHEHFEDFINLIEDEVQEEITSLMNQYTEYDEFMVSIYYMGTSKFKNLIYEMEDLPEFKAVQNFLDTHSIDVSYFIDIFNNFLDNQGPRKARQSGRDFNSFVKDIIELLPKEKLAALYDEKLASDADFKAAIEGLESEEFEEVFSALWANSVFDAEVQALAENGINVELLLDQLVAIFGQDIEH